MTDALADLSSAGVAVWLDDLSRERLRSGNLAALVADRHVVGVTTNPSIFQKALSDGAAYDEQVRDLALRGRAAVANARLAYSAYERVFSSDRWAALATAGARPQRPLWASTGVKDPAYDDTMYVVELVAPGTVNTMPEATLEAVADHGVVRGDTVTTTYAEATTALQELAEAGIDLADVTEQLEVEGVQKFEDAWNALIESVTEQLEAAGADVMPAGAVRPAGDGPASASPEATRR